jgi:hypothetical protein
MDGDIDGLGISDAQADIVARAVIESKLMVARAEADICVTDLSAEAVRVSYAVVFTDGTAVADTLRVMVLVAIVYGTMDTTTPLRVTDGSVVKVKRAGVDTIISGGESWPAPLNTVMPEASRI